MFSNFTFILLLIMYSSPLSNGLQIAEHFAQPNLVANCSRSELHCSLTGASDAVVSWTFHGENAARLPSAHIQRDYADSRWRLIIDCTTIRHAGTYVCNSHPAGKQEIVYRKEAVLQVYVPVQVNIDQPQVKQSNRNSATLKCNITGYPRVLVSWFKLQRNNPSFKSALASSNEDTISEQPLKLYQEAIRLNKHTNSQASGDYESELANVLEGGPSEIQLAGSVYRYVQINGTVDSKFSIENRMLEQFDDSQMQSMLTIHRLDVDDAGLYVCRARNAYGNASENGFRLIVLENPKLRLVSSGSASSRSIELKLAILHNSNAPCQQLLIALRNNNNQTAGNNSASGSNDENVLSSSKDWIIVDIINLQSDQTGNVIGGSIENPQNETNLLLSQYLDNQNNLLLPVNSSTNQFNNAHSKQTRNSKHNSIRSINRFELIEPNVVRYIINNLQPKTDYSVQVFAQNQVGRSAISPIKVETQPDVPSRVKNVHILTRTNETLLYGWRRSADNGAEINRYEVQLAFAHPDNWLRNETKDVNLTSGSGPPRNNYMYIFVGLKPGSTYYFRVRACNEIGCSDYSTPPLLGVTQDGISDPPENIRIRCFAQNQKQHQQTQESKDSSLNIQPLIQYSTNSGEQTSFENHPNFKYQQHQDEDQLSGNEEESNEQNGSPNVGGRSSPTAELLKWPSKRQVNKRSIELNGDQNITSKTNQTEIVDQQPSNLIASSKPQNGQTTDQLQNFITINWQPPLDARGSVVGWNITLDGMSRYINEENKEITERFKLVYEIRSNITNEFTVRVNPNTRYQVRMCAVNRAGCGKLSSFSLNSQCDSAAALNKNRFRNLQATLNRRMAPMINNYPRISSHSTVESPRNKYKLDVQSAISNQLVLNLARLNERDGRILCYRIVMIRLPRYERFINLISGQSNSTFMSLNKLNTTDLTSNQTQQLGNESSIKNESIKFSSIDHSNQIDILSILPSDPMHLPVYRYEQFNNSSSIHQSSQAKKQNKMINTAKQSMYLAYLTKEMSSSQFQSEIVIGDRSESSCSTECVPNDDLHYMTTNNSPIASARSGQLSTVGRRCVFNGDLEPETNYTGFVEIHIANVNGTKLVQRSGYFRPISTGAQPQQLATTTTHKTSTHLTNQLDKLFLDKLNTMFGSMSDHTAAIVFGTICGLTLLLLLFLCFVLCCLKRKTSSNHNQSSPKLADKQRTKKMSISRKKAKDKESMTDLDKCSSDDHLNGINEEMIKLDENEIPGRQNSANKTINHPNTSLDMDFDSSTLKRSCCLTETHQAPLNLDTNQWQASDSFPSPPKLIQQATTKQQQKPTTCQQPTILIDTNQPILPNSANPIHFLHLKQADESNNLANLYEQNLANNLMNINNHLNYDACSLLPAYNQIESTTNYCINNYSHQQAGIDNESTASISVNESDIQLTAHKWIASEFPMKSIHEVFLDRQENDDQLFQIEFNLIPMQFQDRTFNQNPMNKTKNRFQNIKCFNETRVRLNMKQVSFSQTVSTMPRQSSTSSASSGFGGTLSRTLRRKKKANSIDSNDTSSSNNSSTNSAKKQDDSSTTSNSPSILSTSQQQSNSEYIHANHVQLNETSYICTQAPLENTIRDFWQMIVEQGINIVVALCDLEEDGRQVCSSYWNESHVDNGLKQLGEIKIQLVSSRKYADYVLRRFTLTKRSRGNQTARQENEICREIVQFQFLKWNEYAHCGAQPSWLLCFIGKINEYVFENNHLSSPLLVHCEDGCGRTGTFVAVRALMAQIQYNKYQDNLNEQQAKAIKQSTLNIFDYVSQLRYQRYMLVDSVSHYIFIYRACLEYIKFGLDDLNDDYVEQHIKLNARSLDMDYYPPVNRLSYGLNDIVAINYHNITSQSAVGGIILPEFDV